MYYLKNRKHIIHKISMDKKQLIKCNEALRKIEKLDSEIINIEKIAMLVSGGKIESSFELKINDLSRKERQQEVLFDEDESLKTDCMSYGMPFPWILLHTGSSCRQKTQKSKEFDFTLNPALPEASILRILGVLLAELQQERNILVNELQKHNIEI